VKRDELMNSLSFQAILININICTGNPHFATEYVPLETLTHIEVDLIELNFHHKH
jgi:hypothetical protein